MPFDSGGSRIVRGNQHKQIETMQTLHTYSLPAVNPQTLCGGTVLTTHICNQNDQKQRAFLRLQPAIITSVSVIGYWNITNTPKVIKLFDLNGEWYKIEKHPIYYHTKQRKLNY